MTHLLSVICLLLLASPFSLILAGSSSSLSPSFETMAAAFACQSVFKRRCKTQCQRQCQRCHYKMYPKSPIQPSSLHSFHSKCSPSFFSSFSPCSHSCITAKMTLSDKKEVYDYTKQQPQKRDRTYETLPRLYVGPQPSSSSFMNSKKSTSKLQKDAIIYLSNDQSHYLTKVMRFFSKQKKKKGRRRKTPQQQKRQVDSDKVGVTNHEEGEEINLRRCIRIFDGLNGEWLAHVSEEAGDGLASNDSTLKAKCIQSLAPQTKSFSPLSPSWLFLAPIKKEPMKLIFEKCTELGVDAFIPVCTEYTDSSALEAFDTIGDNSGSNANNNNVLFQSNISGNNGGFEKKLQARIIEASEQCERLTVPFLLSKFDVIEKEEGLLDVETLLKYWTETSSDDGRMCKDRVLLICRERKQENDDLVLPIMDVFHNITSSTKNEVSCRPSIAFLIGPEGGWAPNEEYLFDQYCTSYPSRLKCVSLGSSILRAETAAIMAVGSWSVYCDSSPFSPTTR